MKPTKNWQALDLLLNHPDIFNTSGDDSTAHIKKVSSRNFVENDNNKVFMWEGKGAWGFDSIADGIYEAHCGFLKEARGEKADEYSKSVISEMFKSQRAKKIIALSKETYPNVGRFLERIGFGFLKTVKNGTMVGGKKVKEQVYLCLG